MKTILNLGAANINNRKFYVTGKTIFDSGKIIIFDEWKNESVQIGSKVKYNGYTVEYLNCI